MKNFTLLRAAFIALFSIISFAAAAQTPAPFPGPSDNTSAPPTSSTGVLCYGSQIKLTGPTDGTGTMKYDWYKINSGGTAVLVKEGTNNDNAYTETSTDAGFYTYKLIMVNGNGCTSDPSDNMPIYILPQLNAAISATNANICANNQTNSVLSITGLDSRFTYTYQWTRNGTDITTNGTNNTYTVQEPTAGSVSYGVKISYTLNSACSQTPTTTINVIALPAKPVITIGS